MKTVNLLGIRKRVILSRTKSISNVICSVMVPITKEQEKHLDEFERITIDNINIDKKHIYCYGEINLDSSEDVEFIEKFNLINEDQGNEYHLNYNYNTGEVNIEGNIAKMRLTYNPVEWFKYNYVLIGKPKRILLFKCSKDEL